MICVCARMYKLLVVGFSFLLRVKQWRFFHYSNLMFFECLPLTVSPGLSPALCPHCCTYETDRDSLCQPPCLEPCQTPPCLAPPLCWCLWVCNNGEHISHSLTGTITHAKSLTRTRRQCKFTQTMQVCSFWTGPGWNTLSLFTSKESDAEMDEWKNVLNDFLE